MKNKRKHSSLINKRNNQLVGWVFVSPFVIGFVIIFLAILSDGITAAFSTATLGNSGMEFEFSGLKNFYYALRVDPQYVSYALADLKDLIITLPLVMIFSLFVAVLLNGDILGKTFFRAIFFLPVIIATGLLTNLDSGNAVMSTMSAAAVDTSGGGAMASIGDITTFLQQLRFSPTLISTVSGIANNVVDIVNKSGVQILIFLAGIQSISPSVYEAADVEGATEWEKFWKITFPMVKPMILVNLVYTVIECLTGDTTKLMGYIKYNAFTGGKFGEASAMAWIYFLAVAAIMLAVYLTARIIAKATRKMN